MSRGSDTAARVSVPAAIRDLYQRYYSQLVAGLRATYGEGPPDPDDIAQRTFEKLGARGGLAGIDDPEGYTWIAARNLMMSEIRSLGVRTRHTDEARHANADPQCDEFDPERVLIAREELELVMTTLEDMPKRRRDIFLAKRVEGMTAEAAGRKFGVSRTAAVRHIAIATAALAQAIGRGPSDDDEGAQ